MDASRQLFLCVALIVVALSAVSCKKSEEPAAPTQTLQDVPTGAGVEALGLTIGYKEHPDYKYYVHREGDFTKPCTITAADIASSDMSKKDISCLIEGKELDLYYWGMTFKYNVPGSMCSYVVWDPYYYYAYEPRKGPDTISLKINADGETEDLVVTRDGVDAKDDIEMSGTTPTCLVGDYTSVYGPNCCAGSYIVNTSYWNSTTAAYGDPIPTKGKYPGRPANCLRGPAMDLNTGLTLSGYPKGTIKLVEGEGWSEEYEVRSPISHGDVSNVHVANYFNEAEHGGTRPLAMRVPPRGTGLETQPYYELTCLDRAYELRARIRVKVREWNDAQEWAKQGSGNPDTGGAETGYGGGEGINDYGDWKDYGNSYPLPVTEEE